MDGGGRWPGNDLGRTGRAAARTVRPLRGGRPAGRERPVAGPWKDLVYRKAGWISPVLLVDGELAGVWEHTEGKDGLHVDVRPFALIDAAVAQRAATEVERLAAHLGTTVAGLTFSG